MLERVTRREKERGKGGVGCFFGEGVEKIGKRCEMVVSMWLLRIKGITQQNDTSNNKLTCQYYRVSKRQSHGVPQP